MSSGDPGQLAFDLDGMLHAAAVAAAPEWTGAPLHFTTAYFTPTELDAAWAHWHFLHPGPTNGDRPSHVWHRAIAEPVGARLGEHSLDMFAVDLRCRDDLHRDVACSCVGDLMSQVICEPCGWHAIAAGSNVAVEGWHDHALPGWRGLPIVPAQLRGEKRQERWVDERYPEAMQVAGAPIITERGPGGTRHVPGRSPWGGYDLSHTAVDPTHRVRRVWTPERRLDSVRSIDRDLRL